MDRPRFALKSQRGFVYLVGVLCSSLCVLVVYQLFKSFAGLVLAVIVCGISFVTYCALFLPSAAEPAPHSQRNSTWRDSGVIPLILLLLCLSTIVFPPEAAGSQFAGWVSIPLTSYIRFVAAIITVSFLPGYVILQLADKSTKYTGLDSLVFTFFISTFVSSIIYYIVALCGWGPAYASKGLQLVDASLLVLYLAIRIKMRSSLLFKAVTSATRKVDFLILGGIISFFVAGWTILYSGYSLGIPGDMWAHYYESLQLLKGIQLWNPSHLSYIDSEAWFSIPNVFVSLMSGFPAVNGSILYSYSYVFYILAFYQMARGIVGRSHQTLPAVATLIATTFAGFGWMYAVWLGATTGGSLLSVLNAAGSATYNDIIYNFIYGPIPEYFSLAILSSLVYVMVLKDDFQRVDVFIVAALFCESYLVHQPEMILFAAIYFIYVITTRKFLLRRPTRFGLSLVAGLILIVLVGLPFPTHFYFGLEDPVLVIAFLLAASLLLLAVKPRLKMGFGLPKALVPALLLATWIVYGVSFVVWNATLSLNVVGSIGSIGIVPWYLYPVISGMSLLLALIGTTTMSTLSRDRLKHFGFLVMLFVTLLVLGKVLSFVNSDVAATGYWEKRMPSLMVIPTSIIGGWFVVSLPRWLSQETRIGRTRHNLAPVFGGLLIVVIILAGIGSNVLAIERYSLTAQTDPYGSISTSELDALNFLRANVTTGSTVLGLSSGSNYLAYTFSGLNHLNSPYLFLDAPPYSVLDMQSPQLAIKVLQSLNITYLFATKEDIQNLNSSGFAITHLLNYIPIVYQNSDVTVYKVPSLTSPDADSNMSLVVPSELLSSISSPSLLAESIPPQPAYNQSFAGLTYASNPPNDFLPSGGNWRSASGSYEGNSTGWSVQSSLLANMNLSSFSVQTSFRVVTGYYAGIVLRYVNASNYYVVLISVDGRYADIYKNVNGTLTLITHSQNPPLGNGWSSLYVTVIGPSITVFLNDSEIASAYDSQFQDGQVGFAVDASVVDFAYIAVESWPNAQEYVNNGLYLPIDMLAQSGLTYSIKIDSDPTQFKQSTLILSSDTGWSTAEISSYLSWVQRGGHLIVLSGNGFGDFSSLFAVDQLGDSSMTADRLVSGPSTVTVDNITVTGLSVGVANSTITADYCDSYGECVPFAFDQRLGTGTLTYVNVRPVFQALSATNERTQEQIRADFSQLGLIFRMLNVSQAQSISEPSSTAWMYVGYDTTWVRGTVELNGSITYSSDSITMLGQVISVGSLDLSKVTGTIDGTAISASDVFENATISDFAASGTTSLSLNSAKVQITPSDLGPYGEVLLATPTNLTITSGGPSLTFTLTSGQVSAFVNITRGTLKLSQTELLGVRNAKDSLQNVQLVVLNPTFAMNGTLTLQDANVPNYIVSVQGRTVSLIGNSFFKLDDSSYGLLALTNLRYSGAVAYSTSPQNVSQLYWEIQVIPWSSVLASPYTILVFIMGLLVILSIIANKRTQTE